MHSISVVLAVVLWGMSVIAGPALAEDPFVLQAQQKLSILGYDVGGVDGLLGPQTRKALEAFQHDRGLQRTGLPDLPTLQALGLFESEQVVTPSPSRGLASTPLQVVVTYLRLYDYQPARVLPFVTSRFRRDLAPQDWIAATMEAQSAQGYTLLAWKVLRVEEADMLATVEVETRMRVRGVEVVQQETFSLVQAPDRGWLLDDHQVVTLKGTPLSAQGGAS